jgi:hypothetical protein
MDPDVAREVEARAVDGQLACAVAFDVAKNRGVDPEEVGFTADRLEIRIIKCQLGLHGYGGNEKTLKPAENVTEELEASIRDRLENGRLPCKSVWELADENSMGKRDVASACEALGIKITACQLGTF